jgi:cytoplasmic iron level regulating protein YaaA (DUF328/UPF0246 family)
MDLVLLACSNRKQVGGFSDYTPSRILGQALSPSLIGVLLAARAELVKSANKKLPSGPDLDIPNLHSDAEYLPAYQRYTGTVYARGRVQDLYPTQSKNRLVIISALYGLLDGDDLIQQYDLVMDEIISGQRLHTWWKNHGLGRIVEEYIRFYNPAVIHDLLPEKYRKALSPWPPPSLSDRVKSYYYPGQGQGSSYRRGEDLERLLLS